MTKMSFMPALKDFLRSQGMIYTVRKYKMVEKEVEVEGLGTCRRVPIGSISEKEDLLSYVGSSGFSSLEEWWSKIRSFILDKASPMYLYKVELEGSLGNGR